MRKEDTLRLVRYKIPRAVPFGVLGCCSVVSLSSDPRTMLALTLSSSAFVAPLTPAGRHGVAVSMIGGRDGQVNAGGNGKWAPAWKTKVGSGMLLC